MLQGMEYFGYVLHWRSLIGGGRFRELSGRTWRFDCTSIHSVATTWKRDDHVYRIGSSLLIEHSNFKHYFIALQKVNSRDLLVKVDGYDNRSYADIQKKMEETIASLDPKSRSFTLVRTLNSFQTCHSWQRKSSMSFPLKFRFLSLDKTVTWPGRIKRLLT